MRENCEVMHMSVLREGLVADVDNSLQNYVAGEVYIFQWHTERELYCV